VLSLDRHGYYDQDLAQRPLYYIRMTAKNSPMHCNLAFSIESTEGSALVN
jgi:hypothetical protein